MTIENSLSVIINYIKGFVSFPSSQVVQKLIILFLSSEYFLFFFLVTKEKPFQVRIYKVQKSEKEVFKKKVCWQLSDLKEVDGISEKAVIIPTHFTLVPEYVLYNVD